MNLCIIGNGTLAQVTRTCCWRHFDLTDRPSQEYDLIWFCEDTPIENDEPKYQDILDAISRVAHMCASFKKTLLISSQIQVGTVAKLEAQFPNVDFAYSPENIRVAHGVPDFEQQARVVIGRRTPKNDETYKKLFSPFTNNLIMTDPETAECVKHFLNCWLGMTIAYTNEMARFCKQVGADPETVSKSMLTERRISPNAPMKPGHPYGGGHLARDIYTVNQIAREKGLKLPLINHIKESNECTQR